MQPFAPFAIGPAIADERPVTEFARNGPRPRQRAERCALPSGFARAGGRAERGARDGSGALDDGDPAFVQMLKESVKGKREAVPRRAGAKTDRARTFLNLIFAARCGRARLIGAAGNRVFQDRAFCLAGIFLGTAQSHGTDAITDCEERVSRFLVDNVFRLRRVRGASVAIAVPFRLQQRVFPHPIERLAGAQHFRAGVERR